MMKYHWPYYIPHDISDKSSFFGPAIVSVIKKLKVAPVLSSCAGTMVLPPSLVYVLPDQFSDAEGIPFTMSDITSTKYLSIKYPLWTIGAIRTLGVNNLSPKDFLKDLKSIILADTQSFESRSANWHSQLAKALIPLATNNEHLLLLRDLRIIPLGDGSWTSVQGQNIYFSKNTTALDIPSGIKMLTVDAVADENRDRHTLFQCLGIKSWDASEICRRITETHAALKFDPESFTCPELITHAAFLYKASWQPRNRVDLWFVTTRGKRSPGSELYILRNQSDLSTPAVRLLSGLRKYFPFLHDDYFKIFPSDANWPKWLVKTLHLSCIPHLVKPLGNKLNYTLSEEFTLMFRECPTSDVLHLLEENWSHYSKWILTPTQPTDKTKKQCDDSASRLRREIGAMKVLTKTMGRLPLRDTVLPMIDPDLEKSICIPSLELEESQDIKWMNLSHFGVILKADCHYYLRCLFALQDLLKPDVIILAYLYEKIQERYNDNEELIAYV